MQRIIFFDGVCPLCNHFVDFVIKRDRKKIFLFSSLQSPFAKASLPATYLSLDSIILKENNDYFLKSTAVLRVLFQLGPGWNAFAIFASIIPRFIRDIIYNFIAKNRYKIWGRNEVCRIPTADEKKLFIESFNPTS